MMFLLILALVFSLVLLFVSFSNLLLSPILEKQKNISKNKKEKPLVSLLIPCRNEERNISSLLKNIVSQSYSNTEIIIYDDNSTDSTLEILRKEKKKYSSKKISIVQGTSLPLGWTGKNYACYQLSKKAKGDYFCFLDADVLLSKKTIEKLLSVHKGGLLTIFPVQIKKSLGEWFVVPLMKWFLLSFLPFSLIRKSSREEFVAANGQLIFFSKQAYKSLGGHKAVYNDIVEDMALARLAKKEGLLVQTFISNSLVSCRMYNSFLESVMGFSRSFFPGTNLSRFSFFLLMLVFSITFFVPFIFLPSTLSIIIISALIINKILVAIIQRDYKEALFFPIHIIMFIILGLVSLSRRVQKWKGRSY